MRLGGSGDITSWWGLPNQECQPVVPNLLANIGNTHIANYYSTYFVIIFLAVQTFFVSIFLSGANSSNPTTGLLNVNMDGWMVPSTWMICFKWMCFELINVLLRFGSMKYLCHLIIVVQINPLLFGDQLDPCPCNKYDQLGFHYIVSSQLVLETDSWQEVRLMYSSILLHWIGCI